MLKKRFTSLFLALAMVLGLSGQAFAANELTSAAADESAMIYTHDTPFEGIKASDDGEYAITSADGSAVPVGMLQVDLLNQEEYSAVINSPDLSEAVKESLTSKRNHALELGKNAQYVSIFSPHLLANNGIEAYAIPAGKTNYTWNGHTFLIERVITYGHDSDWQKIAKGPSTKEKASAIFDVALAMGGVTKKIELVASAAGKISLLAAFLELCNLSNANFIPGTSEDYLDAVVTADTYEQWTWGKILNTDPDWFLGVYTKKVDVKKVETRQHYYVASESGYRTETKETPINDVLVGEHYTDDWQQSCKYAWDNRMSTVHDPALTWKLGEKIFTY